MYTNERQSAVEKTAAPRQRARVVLPAPIASLSPPPFPFPTLLTLLTLQFAKTPANPLISHFAHFFFIPFFSSTLAYVGNPCSLLRLCSLCGPSSDPAPTHQSRAPKTPQNLRPFPHFKTQTPQNP